MKPPNDRDPHRQALVLAPHHDDEAIGCGGLVTQLAGRGWDVAIAVLFAPIDGIDTAAYHTRIREAEVAAAVLGGHRVGDFDLPCRQPVALETLSWDLVRLFRRVRPSLILAPHAADRDTEHLATHRACVEALWLATSPFRPDLGPPMPTVDTVLGYEVWGPIANPQLTLDISAVMETKLEAIRAYGSQMAVADYAQAARGLSAYRGVMHGGCAFAESYSVIEIHENALSFTALR